MTVPKQTDNSTMISCAVHTSFVLLATFHALQVFIKHKAFFVDTQNIS